MRSPIHDRAIGRYRHGATLDDVRHVGRGSIETCLVEKFGELPAGDAFERQARRILLFAWRFADDHQVRPDIAVAARAPEDDFVARMCQRAPLAHLGLKSDIN
jgi:hypothetical protein